MTLMITAFGPFDGGWNVSDRLLDALERDRAEVEEAWGAPVAFVRLVVDTETIERQLDDALAEVRPSHLLLMGQAAARDGLTLERAARNRRDLAAPDACGRRGPLGPVRAGGPDLRAATWPDLAGAAAALAQAGFSATVSDDAGAHLCNQALYLALERAGPPATFLHLPPCAEQVADRVPAALRRPKAPRLTIAEMARAVGVVLRHTRTIAAAA
ncbi:hypothetical protein [Methylopila henanensis]